MKKKLLPVGLLMSFPICLSPILIVNSCRSNLPENNEMTLENFVANIKPTLKTNKENLKAQTLASSIQTEDDVKNWYDNLPQSQSGINVTFRYASSDDTKGVLKIEYLIEKNGNQLPYTKEDNGFKISDKNQDRIDVEDFISKLNDPVIKENKKSEQPTTPAENIRTQTEINEWFDGLWSGDAEKGIQVSFLRTETNSNNSSIEKGVLRVYYQIQKGSYTIDFYWETSGFQIETPSTSQPSTGTTKFKITFKRSNGKLLDNYYPVINFYKDGNTNGSFERKYFYSNVNEFELPTGTYRCVIDSVIPNGMEVNKEFTISEQNPSYDIIFRPKDLQNQPTPENYRYQYNDVLFQTEYTDVNDNKVKLSDNIKNKKVTLIMFYKIDCPYSANMYNQIARWKEEAGIKDRFDAWLFSAVDSKERLKSWSATWKDFKVFSDENYAVTKHYFDGTAIPKFCFIDQEGVLISKFEGQINNLKDFLLELLN